MNVKGEVFLNRIKLDLYTSAKVLNKSENHAAIVAVVGAMTCGYLYQEFVVSPKYVWETKNKLQAEDGFGSRRIFVSCFASVIEFGPQ
jgi:hypothetical protein